MNDRLHKLRRRYTATLRKYLANRREAILEQAYELGRMAISQKLGVLDMARVHGVAVEEILRRVSKVADHHQVLRGVESFFLEALSPFEATHRGFQETNLQLQQLNAVLEKRNGELETEMGERRRVEEALRQSGMHYRQLFNEAQTMQENLRNLSNKILHVQEEERKRISRELHDEVGQALTAISVTFATLKSNGSAKSEIIQRQLSDSESLLQETMERVHRFARELRPAMLDELGLLPALRSLLNGFARRTGLRVRFQGNADAEKLDGDQKTVLFRVAQESLTNVAKHAKASRVDVSIRKVGNGICLEVKDDGKSFQEKPETSNEGVGRLGLLGMQERARLVSGTLTIRAQPGKGTAIRVAIPFTPSRKPVRALSGNRFAKRSHPSRRLYAKNSSLAG